MLPSLLFFFSFFLSFCLSFFLSFFLSFYSRPLVCFFITLLFSFLLLAHLSRRLICELIGYSWSGVRPSSVCRRRRSQCSKIFFSETAGSIKTKFYVEPLKVGGTKVRSLDPGHMTKMAAMSIYGKNSKKIFFSRTGGPIPTKPGM